MTWIRCGLLALVLASLVGATGCKRSRTAQLVVINTSHRAWRVVLVPRAQAEPREWRIEPRQTLEADVPPGDYKVEQVLLTSAGDVAETRHLSARLERGRHYRWRLATLLSDSP